MNFNIQEIITFSIWIAFIWIWGGAAHSNNQFSILLAMSNVRL